MPYNPFDKPLGQNLTASDLQQLVERKVAEGYFVEYKRQFPSSEKVGHSIASLANTGGGWYFVGVEEQGRVASHIGGCPTADERDPVKRLRDIVKTHIDPVPIFYPQEVQLEDEKWVLAVYVPNEQETPFITKNGRIYRRTFDSSDPVPETSRHALDRLYDAGRDIRQRFAEFCQDPRIFSKSEDKTGWISVFLAPSPIGGIERFDLLSPSGIEALLQLVASPVPLRFIEAEEWASGNIAFVWAQPTVRSVILRQLEPNRAAFNSMQAE